jgi:hypothetical protein
LELKFFHEIQICISLNKLSKATKFTFIGLWDNKI